MDDYKYFTYNCASKLAQYAELAAVIKVLMDKKGSHSKFTIVLCSDWVFRGAVLMLAWWAQNEYWATDGGEIKFSNMWQMLDDIAKQFDKVDMAKIWVHRKKGPLVKGNQAADLADKQSLDCHGHGRLLWKLARLQFSIEVSNNHNKLKHWS
ncbi:unnamed protein product [Caretta caretta]